MYIVRNIGTVWAITVRKYGTHSWLTERMLEKTNAYIAFFFIITYVFKQVLLWCVCGDMTFGGAAFLSKNI